MNGFPTLVRSTAFARLVKALGFSFAFVQVLSLAGCVGSNESSVSAKSSGGANLCIGQAANTFHCIDDTSFQHCTGDSTFVVKACPANLCATRTPAIRNPCVGRERAAEIDGVVPPAAGKASPPVTPPAVNNNTGATAGANTGGNTGAVNTGVGGKQCVGGPKFDPAGEKNVGNGSGLQFIGGQCLSAADCASGCCANPCGICSGVGAQFQAGKTGCGFGN